MADEIIDFYKKAKEPEEPQKPIEEQKETPVPEIPKPDEPFDRFLLELAEKLQKEKVITEKQQETFVEQIKEPVSTDPNENDPFKKFIGSFANILKEDELVNREENIKEATISFINKLKEQPEELFIIQDEQIVKNKKQKYLPPKIAKKVQKLPQPLKKEEPVVEEQADEPVKEENTYVKELKTGDKTNKKLPEKVKSVSDIKSIVEKQVAEILSRYPNLGFTGGGGGTNAVQYALGGSMDGDLNITGSVNASTYLSGGVNLVNILSSSGGGGEADRLISGSESLILNPDGTLEFPNDTIRPPDETILTLESENPTLSAYTRVALSPYAFFAYDNEGNSITFDEVDNAIVLTSQDEHEWTFNKEGVLVGPHGALTVDALSSLGRILSGDKDLTEIFLTSETDSQTLTFTESSAQLTVSNGNTVSLSSLQSNYIYTNTSQNVLFNRKYAFDTSSSTLTATLPESPQIGDEIEFFDIGGAWSTNSLIINSSNYIEQRLEPINCNVRFGLIKLIYTNNSVGWRLIPYPRHDILPIFAPDVSIQVDVSSGFVPLTINFTGINNLGQEIAPVTTWTWNMTGGNTPQFTTQNVTYTYQTSGTYIANLTAINSVGIDTTSITVSATTPTLPTSGLFVWFNADSGVATSGSAVTSWTDQQNGVVATAFNGPTLLTNQLNGRNAISFDGANDYFTGTFASNLANGSARTFIIIGKYNTMSGQTGMFDGSSDLEAYIFQNSGNLYYNNGPQIGPVTGNWTANYFIQIINTASNGSTTYRVNGVNRVSGTMNRPVMTGFNIGRRGSSSEYANCNIVDLLVYNRSLTLGEMEQIESYANVP